MGESGSRLASRWKQVAALAVVGYWLHLVVTKVVFAHWLQVERVTFSDFKAASDATVRGIPVTYYEPGKLADVLHKWDHSFHLYRVRPGSKAPALDRKGALAQTEVRVKTIDEKCQSSSVVCPPCFVAGQVDLVNITDVWDKNGLYASFASLESDAMNYLWDSLKLQNINMGNVEHAFISNLKEPMVTAAIHANPMSSSMSVQFMGTKTWLFLDPGVYLGSSGFASKPAAPIQLPRKAPTEPWDVYVYKGLPGDVLFFTENWAHAVKTGAGPNLMVNFRQVHAGNVLADPINWAHAAFNLRFFGQPTHNLTAEQRLKQNDNKVPEKYLNKVAYDHFAKMCATEGADGTSPPLDAQMLKLFNHKELLVEV